MNKPIENQAVNSRQTQQQNLRINCCQENRSPFNASQTPKRNADTSPTILNHNRAFQNQHVVYQSEGLHQTPMQQIRRMQEPIQRAGGVLSAAYCHQFSPVTSTSFQDSTVPGISSTSFDFQTTVGDNKRISQFQVAYTKPPSDPFLDANSVYAAERKLLLDKYYASRGVHLPKLMGLQKCVEECSIKSQSEFEREKAQKLKFKLGQMINFLILDENALKNVSNKKLHQYLIRIVQALNMFHYEGAMASQNQVPQFSNGHSWVNQLQNTPSVQLQRTTLPITPLISTPVMGQVLQNLQPNAPNLQPSAANTKSNPPCSQLNAPYSSLCGSNAPERVDMPTVLNKVPQVATEQSDCLSLKKNSEPMKPSSIDQSSKKMQLKKPRKVPEKKDFMDSMFLPRTKVKSRIARSHPSKGHPSCVSVPKAISQMKPSAKESGKPDKFGVTAVKCEIEIEDKCGSMEYQWTLESSMSSRFCDQSNHHPKSALLPFERLIQAIQSVSPELLKVSINDISSAFAEMDRLPKYSFHDGSKISIDDNLVDFPREMNSGTGDEHMTSKRLKREFDVKCKDAPTRSDNKDSGMERPRKTANHDLVVTEVIEINHKLIQTWVEVLPDSAFDSAFREGTIVRCMYMPIAYSDDLKRHFVSIVPLSLLSVDFLVPPHYPKISPIILDSSKLPDGCSQEGEIILGRARAMLDRSIRGLISIGEMAKAWDDCGRKTFTKLAIRHGGKTFSDRYGVWKNVGLSQTAEDVLDSCGAMEAKVLKQYINYSVNA